MIAPTRVSNSEQNKEAPNHFPRYLPFENRSNRDEDQFFTDGIHDDLLTQISQIKETRTLARTSVEAYEGTTKRMKVIGEELGVKWLLEGGVSLVIRIVSRD